MASSSPTKSQHRWLPVARGLWVILVLVYFGVFATSLPAGYRANLTICEGSNCRTTELTLDEIRIMRQYGISHSVYAGLATLSEATGLVWAALGLFVFIRRSHDWLGLLVSLALIAVGTNGLSDTVSVLASQNPAWAPLFNSLSGIAIASFILLIVLMPDGRFVPGWTRYFAVPLAALALADPILAMVVPPLETSPGTAVSFGVLLTGVVSGVIAQIQRYRKHSSLEQRQQTKWVIFGFGAFMILVLTWALTVELRPLSPGTERVAFLLGAYPLLLVLILILPMTMTISILRYRLWDIDILINRTLIYGSLTALLLSIYLASVFLLQSLLRLMTGQKSQLAIVAATLLSLALFSPLRARLQGWIDRRFYRRKYDAQTALIQFGREARDEVELRVLRDRLLGVVSETMQPKHISIWLKEDR